MLIVKISGDRVTAKSTVRPPVIYFDHWAFREFSQNVGRRTRFLSFLAHRGTIAVSMMNLMEASKNAGNSMAALLEFADNVGPYWFPVNSDIRKVKEREGAFKAGGNNPYFDEDLVEGVLADHLAYMSGGALSLKKVFELTQTPAFHQAATRNKWLLGRQFRRLMGSGRKRHKSGETLRQLPDVTPESRPQPSMQDALDRLMQVVLKECAKLEDNDACDFMHAALGLACADIVLLDSKWADWARKTGLSRSHVRVYEPRTLDDFLSDLHAGLEQTWLRLPRRRSPPSCP
jgi:hypothetical protein